MGDADPIFRLMGNLDNAALTEIPDGAALRTLGWLEDGAEVHGIIANVQIALTTEKASTRLDSLNGLNYGVYCTKSKKKRFSQKFSECNFHSIIPGILQKDLYSVYTTESVTYGCERVSTASCTVWPTDRRTDRLTGRRTDGWTKPLIELWVRN